MAIYETPCATGECDAPVTPVLMTGTGGGGSDPSFAEHILRVDDPHGTIALLTVFGLSDPVSVDGFRRGQRYVNESSGAEFVCRQTDAGLAWLPLLGGSSVSYETVSEMISQEIEATVAPMLSGYATTESLSGYVSSAELADMGFLTADSLAGLGYATEDFVSDALSDYLDESEMDGPDGFVRKTALDVASVVTLSALASALQQYATRAYADALFAAAPTMSALEGVFATASDLESAVSRCVQAGSTDYGSVAKSPSGNNLDVDAALAQKVSASDLPSAVSAAVSDIVQSSVSAPSDSSKPPSAAAVKSYADSKSAAAEAAAKAEVSSAFGSMLAYSRLNASDYPTGILHDVRTLGADDVGGAGDIHLGLDVGRGDAVTVVAPGDLPVGGHMPHSPEISLYVPEPDVEFVYSGTPVVEGVEIGTPYSAKVARNFSVLVRTSGFGDAAAVKAVIHETIGFDDSRADEVATMIWSVVYDASVGAVGEAYDLQFGVSRTVRAILGDNYGGTAVKVIRIMWDAGAGEPDHVVPDDLPTVAVVPAGPVTKAAYEEAMSNYLGDGTWACQYIVFSDEEDMYPAAPPAFYVGHRTQTEPGASIETWYDVPYDYDRDVVEAALTAGRDVLYRFSETAPGEFRCSAEPVVPSEEFSHIDFNAMTQFAAAYRNAMMEE